MAELHDFMTLHETRSYYRKESAAGRTNWMQNSPTQ